MNLLLLPPESLSQKETQVTGARAKHISQVLKKQPGQPIKVGVEGFGVGTAQVKTVASELITLHDLNIEQQAEPPPVELYLALPRPKVLLRIVENAASLGVTKLVLLNTWRVDKSYFDSPLLADNVLASHARIGCEQGMIPFVPTIQKVRFFMDQIALFAGAIQPTGWLFHPYAESYFEATVPCGKGESARFVIGPEGGLIPNEIKSLQDVGFVPVKLGERILRVETALSFALGQWDLLRRTNLAKGT